MFTSLGQLINSRTRNPKVSEALYAISVRKVFKEVLLENCSDLPPEVLGKIKAVSFADGILTVRVQGLAKAELLMRSGGLIKGVNKALSRKVVFKIKLRSY